MQPIRQTIFLLIFALSFGWCKVGLASHPYEQMATELSKTVELYKGLNQEAPKYEVVFRRDPMRALIDNQGNVLIAAGLHQGLALQGMVWSQGFNKVLIDDEFYGPGDEVGPYKIMEIRPDGLLAQEGEKSVFVPLYRDNEPVQEKEK